MPSTASSLISTTSGSGSFDSRSQSHLQSPPQLSSGNTHRATRYQDTEAAELLQTPSLITCGQRSVRARIDKNVPVEEIIKQLCASTQLSITEPASLYCLRDAANGELVSDDNISRKIDAGANFRLVSAPGIEAIKVIEKLNGNDAGAVKQATFQVTLSIREDAFVAEFVGRKGVQALATVTQSSTGNTLAYALNALQLLLDLEYGLDDLDESFVQRVVNIISTQALVNIVRPALVIMRRLVSTNHEMFGFDKVWPALSPSSSRSTIFASPEYEEAPRSRSDDFFRALATKIAREGDKHLLSGALALLTVLMKYTTKQYFLDTCHKLEMFSFRKAVISLIENHAEDVTPHILQFQQSYATLWHQQSLLSVQFSSDVQHFALLHSILAHSGLSQMRQAEESVRGLELKDPKVMQYTQIGFSSADLKDIEEQDFSAVGMFGLITLHHIARNRREDFSRMVLEQVNRPTSKRCPIALVSLQVSRLLLEYFDLSGSLASASFQPFLLDYYRIHFLVMEFFIRMYSDSGALINDFPRVANLTTSQLRMILGANGSASSTGRQGMKSYFAVKQEFEEVSYEEVRNRQMKELELDDDLLSKLPARNLRDRLYRESFSFIKAQRLSCLHLGAWFAIREGSAGAGSHDQRQRPVSTATYRFCRLASNRKYLHYLDVKDRRRIAPGVEDLPNKIDMSIVTEVVNGMSSRPSVQTIRSRTSVASPLSSSAAGPRSPPLASQSDISLSIALLSQDNMLAELVAPNASTLSEWLDGLNVLLPDGFIVTKESADYIQSLTDIGVKLKMLDLTGEKIDIPLSIPIPIVPPPHVPFFYAK